MKIEKLTEEQRNKLKIYREKYLDIFFNNKKLASKKEVKEYIHWFYSKFNISTNKRPMVILVDSPLECLIAKKYLDIFLKNKNLKNKFNNEIGNEVWEEVGNEVMKEISDEFGHKVTNEVVNEVWNEVSNEIRTEVSNEIRNKNLKWVEPTYYLSAFNSWISFYDFFDKECFKLKNSEIFNEYKKVLDLNIFWSIAFKNAVIVSRNAVKFNRNSRKQLHSVNEPAIQFGGKYPYSKYYINGRNISKSLFEKLSKKEYTFKEFLEEKNEEIKNACIGFMQEKWGDEYLCRFLNSELIEIDTFVDKKNKIYLKGTTEGMNVGVYTLFKGNINNVNVAYVRCYCPSTDRIFYLGVDSNQTNAKDAIASLYRTPKILKNHIKSIQRQGERFSTTFTEKGLSLLKSLSKEEISDLTSLNGEEYFNLMTYEF